MTDFVNVTRDDERARIRVEWLADWQAHGWQAPPEAAPTIAPGITREDIAKMPKGDVLDLLAAHGVEGDSKAPVADLRAQLISVVFFDG